MRIPEERPCAQGAVEAAKRRGASAAREGEAVRAVWASKKEEKPAQQREGRQDQTEGECARPIRDFQETEVPSSGWTRGTGEKDGSRGWRGAGSDPGRLPRLVRTSGRRTREG